MMFFQRRGNTPQHDDSFFFRRFEYLHNLEAAGEGRIFFKIFPVLRPGGGADGAQRTARKGGF